MTARAAAWRRWGLVGLGATLLVASPAVVRSWPVPDADVPAAEVLASIEASADRAYSGYVESRGTLALPVADRFTDVGRLFGEETRLRVWWRGADSWRVDRLTTTGETDLIHTGPIHAGLGQTWRWRYEGFDLDLAGGAEVRLPRPDDLLPPQVAELLLAGADSDEVSRLPAQRVAGRTALGLRLTPSAPQSSIARVELWADAVTGLPLRVLVYDAGSVRPALTTQFREVSLDAPADRLVGFVPPPGADIDLDPPLDVADAANRYADVRPPRTLAGLRRTRESTGAVGVYGTGVARMIAVPLWDRAAEPLRKQLRVTPAARLVDAGAVLTVGPLNLLLTELPCGGGWLVSGTVTRRTLLDAAAELESVVEEVADR